MEEKKAGPLPAQEKSATTKAPARARIVIDERESKEYDRLLAAAECACERQTLSVGDFVLSSRLVAERKGRADFEASIVDGRLFEQAQRLVQSYQRVVVVVEGEREGSETGRTGRVSRAALLGAYGALVADFGISLFFTKNPSGTAELLSSLAKHEQLARKLELRVMAKPKCLTIGQFQRALIECLPQVGPAMAKKLLAHFGTPANIILADEKKLMEVEGMGAKKAKQIRRVLDSVFECENGEE